MTSKDCERASADSTTVPVRSALAVLPLDIHQLGLPLRLSERLLRADYFPIQSRRQISAATIAQPGCRIVQPKLADDARDVDPGADRIDIRSEAQVDLVV